MTITKKQSIPKIIKIFLEEINDTIKDIHDFLRGINRSVVGTRALTSLPPASPTGLRYPASKDSFLEAPLSTFLEYCTYGHMIDNVVLIVTGTLHDRDVQELLEKCHPLGMFDGIASLAVAQNVQEIYKIVLIDTPLAKYFSESLSVEGLFGLPQRKLINDVFVSLSIQAGCDSVMIDPIMNNPESLQDFMFAANALTGKDEYSMKYLKHIRAKTGAKRGS